MRRLVHQPGGGAMRERANVGCRLRDPGTLAEDVAYLVGGQIVDKGVNHTRHGLSKPKEGTSAV